MTTKEILIQAKNAVSVMSTLDTDKKNRALSNMAQALEDDAASILEANALDMESYYSRVYKTFDKEEVSEKLNIDFSNIQYKDFFNKY